MRARLHIVRIHSAQKHCIGVLGLNGPPESSDGPAHLEEALRGLYGYTRRPEREILPVGVVVVPRDTAGSKCIRRQLFVIIDL